MSTSGMATAASMAADKASNGFTNFDSNAAAIIARNSGGLTAV